MDISVIDAMPENTSIEKGLTLNKSEIMQVLTSSDAKTTLATIIAARQKISSTVVASQLSMDSAGIKAYLTTAIITYYFSPDHINALFQEYRNGSVEVYQETAIFMLIKFAPQSMIQSLVNRTGNSSITSSITQKVTQVIG